MTQLAEIGQVLDSTEDAGERNGARIAFASAAGYTRLGQAEKKSFNSTLSAGEEPLTVPGVCIYRACEMSSETGRDHPLLEAALHCPPADAA